MARRRRYSIPYNGTKPDWFVRKTMEYLPNLDHVFCELPYEDMLSHTRFQFNGVHSENLNLYSNNQARCEYVKKCIDFLRLSEGKFRRICPINAMYYKHDSEKDLINFALKICNVVSEFKIDGLIITDYRLGLLLRQLMPDLELHTSCNCYQWVPKQIEIWRDKVGIKVFNPPREILRYPSKLKEMKDMGIKLKCIVNEGCLVGCPNSFNHQLAVSLKCYFGGQCIQNGIGDIFKGNWILPRWQKHYDKYVDIYKIAGRNSDGDYPFMVLDAFLREEDNMPLTDLMMSGIITASKHFLPRQVQDLITLNKVPDKLLTCECRDCKKCNLCEKILKGLIPVEYQSAYEMQRFQQYLQIDGIEQLRKNKFQGAVIV